MSLVTDYLEAHGIPYEVLHHDPASTSLEEANAVHLDADRVLKAVVIDSLRGRAVAVVPASERLDIHLVREALGDPEAYLASEPELRRAFPAIELGAAPPIGGIFDAVTVVDPSVLDHDRVVFAAGERTESVSVRTLDLFGDDVVFAPLLARSHAPASA
jgi:Ala-tRNA(Pro) deacylase